MRLIGGTAIASAAMLGLAACAGMTPSERGALTGAAVGGAAGAILGDDEAALAGAVVGGAAGWYLGCREEGRCGNVENRRQRYDQLLRPAIGTLFLRKRRTLSVRRTRS
jgi:osmotically inducible lipoprotein OsmB